MITFDTHAMAYIQEEAKTKTEDYLTKIAQVQKLFITRGHTMHSSYIYIYKGIS